MTKRAHGRKSLAEHLDEDDRLVQVSKGVYTSGAVLVNEFTVNYSYDSMGRMLRRDNGTDVTTFVWDGWDLLSETTDSVVTTHLVPDGLVWSFSRGEDVFQVHTDALGSVRVVTDSDGDVVARFEYSGWGELLPGSFDGVGLALRFVGGRGVRTDLETGLLCMRHRWYDPASQRFISRDPIGLNGGANLYAYVEGMPQNVTDETGLKPPLPRPVRPQGRPTRGDYISPQMQAEMMRVSPSGYRAVMRAGEFNIPVRPGSGPASLPGSTQQTGRQGNVNVPRTPRLDLPGPSGAPKKLPQPDRTPPRPQNFEGRRRVPSDFEDCEKIYDDCMDNIVNTPKTGMCEFNRLSLECEEEEAKCRIRNATKALGF